MNEDKAARYHRLRRRASVAGSVLGVLLLVVLLVAGWSASLRDLASAVGGGRFLGTVALYTVILAVASRIVQLPLAFYQGVTLERRYGLSVQTTAQWWSDWAKASGLAVVFAAAGALLAWSLLRASPRHWWLIAALSFACILVVLAQLAPVLLLPLFYTFKPLERPALAARLVALAERCGARILGVFEWQLSDRTRKANAALAGIGRTRRILLSDTVLAEYTDDEIEVVVAHELAHHVHRDLWKALAVESALLTAALWAAHRVLDFSVGRFGISARDDVAALPLLLLAAGAVSLVFLPLANALSRADERRADRFALDVTGKAAAFVSAMRRLAAQNLAEERPPRIVELLFHTHPPIGTRIDAARAWESRSAMNREVSTGSR